MKRLLLMAGMMLAGLLVISAPVRAQQPDRMTWSGDVDDTIRIHIQGSNVTVDVLKGHDVQNMKYHVLEPLVTAPAQVVLDDVDGRGSVRLVHEPDATNNYTATVEIEVPQPGSGHYHFALTW